MAKKQSKQTTTKAKTKTTWWQKPKAQSLLIVLIGFILYANTLGHDYTQDDAIVIYDNMFTQKGIAGIPGILSNDTFYGFFKEDGKANLVSGGRYRPFSQILFALEWQIFGRSPFVGHFVNALLYGLLGWILYHSLYLLIIGNEKKGKKEKALRLFIFITCILYIAHPIHTEAVANIKGRDEILSMMGSMLALWMTCKYYYTAQLKWAFNAFLFFSMALFSKENTITFMAVIPLGLMFFKRVKLTKSINLIWPLIIATIVFLSVRFSILGWGLGEPSGELMNNPFLKLQNGQWVPLTFTEKYSTIIFTLGKYLSLLFWPHPLVHDYYPRAVEVMDIGSWKVWISIMSYVLMIAGALYFWSRDRIIAFGILFYLLTLTIVSNVVFPIGTNMSERFMFMPSLGFAVVMSRLLTKYIKSEKLVYILVGLIFIGYSAKTLTRNLIWESDYSLFINDVKLNPRSAKLLNAAGGVLSTTAANENNKPRQVEMLNLAVGYLNEAIAIHPTYRNAHLLLGNSLYYLGDYDKAIPQYEKLLSMFPNYGEGLKNYPIILRDAGRYYGQEKNDLQKSITLLKRSFDLDPTDYETCRLLGITQGITNNHDQAIFYFNKAIELNPKSAASYVSMGTAYANKGDEEKAKEYYKKALELDPKALDNLVN